MSIATLLHNESEMLITATMRDYPVTIQTQPAGDKTRITGYASGHRFFDETVTTEPETVKAVNQLISDFTDLNA